MLTLYRPGNTLWNTNRLHVASVLLIGLNSYEWNDDKQRYLWSFLPGAAIKRYSSFLFNDYPSNYCADIPTCILSHTSILCSMCVSQIKYRIFLKIVPGSLRPLACNVVIFYAWQKTHACSPSPDLAWVWVLTSWPSRSWLIRGYDITNRYPPRSFDVGHAVP